MPDIDPKTVVIFGTHTHAAVECRQDPPLVERFAELGIESPLEWSWWGMDLGVKPSPGEYFEFASGWNRRQQIAVRIADLALATNPFELYLDYGIQIKARGKAVQTMTVQLANGYFRYLPTERALAGGAYGAILESNEADPEAGRKLVEQTLEMIESLWEEKSD